MDEQAKAARRRSGQPAYVTYFTGDGLDVGGGAGALESSRPFYPKMGAVRCWDKEDGDAEKLIGIADNSVDFLHASHILEHLVDPWAGMQRWIEVVKPGGHIICCVPCEQMYEHDIWPSRFSNEHLWSFTVYRPDSPMTKSISLLPFLMGFGTSIEVERIIVVRDGFDPNDPCDQTLKDAECAIETVLRKR